MVIVSPVSESLATRSSGFSLRFGFRSGWQSWSNNSRLNLHFCFLSCSFHDHVQRLPAGAFSEGADGMMIIPIVINPARKTYACECSNCLNHANGFVAAFAAPLI